MIDSEQFYPTPQALTAKAHKLFNKSPNHRDSKVLDPSCGTGSLLNYTYGRWNYTGEIDADVCEINPERLKQLETMDHVTVVGHDFLQFMPSKKYSHIIMNPPFRNGVQHLLHAWDISYNTEIVCILNAQSIKNNSTKDRELLSKLIEQHGSVEYHENEFINAERSTSVEVALIYLKKETAITKDYTDGLDLDKYNPEFKGYQGENSLAIPNNIIENAVRIFNQSRVLLERKVEASAVLEAKYASVSCLLGGSLYETSEEGEKRIKSVDIAKASASPESITSSYNFQLGKLKESAWNYVLSGIGFYDTLTSKAKKEFDAQFAKVSKMEFTEQNIHGLLSGVALDRGKMMEDIMIDLFDKFTGYHIENRNHYRSYKSNEKHRTNAFRLKTTRIVLPVKLWNDWSPELAWEAREKLADFDKAFAMLDGKSEKEVKGLVDSIKNTSQIGKRHDSEYFEFRLYKNGNAHLFPKNKKLIDRLNRIVGKKRQWLPQDDEEATKEFWRNYNSDKTQKDIDKADIKHDNWMCREFNQEELEKVIEESLSNQKIDCSKFINKLEKENG